MLIRSFGTSMYIMQRPFGRQSRSGGGGVLLPGMCLRGETQGRMPANFKRGKSAC